jgi:tetratricopeptide (TPR) repeat protein
MVHTFKAVIAAGAISVMVLSGCEETPKKTKPSSPSSVAPRQKVESSQKYQGAPAARLPGQVQPAQKPEPVEASAATVAEVPNRQPQAESVPSDLPQKLEAAIKEKTEAEKTAEALRKALDEQRAINAEAKKALEETRARLAELQAGKSRPDSDRRQGPRDEDALQKLLALARGFYDQNDFVSARRLLQGLVDLGYENGALFFMLGRCCAETDDPKGALSNYDKACDAFQDVKPRPPQYVYALNNMGAILRSQGRFTDAEEVYRKAIKADPSYANAYYNLGLLYEECLKDNQKAVDAFEKHIDLRGERYIEVQERIKRLRAVPSPQKK